MSFITGLLSGSKGTNFEAQGTNIVQPFNAGDVQASNQAAKDALAQQQNFTNSVATGQGLQGGNANLQNSYNSFGDVAAGKGPNPAAAMLNTATGNNVASQAALMASQRGASANPAAAARNAALAGVNAQQQAAGQGATLQAQQSLNALGQQAGVAGQQAGIQSNAIQNQTSAEQNQQQLLQNQVNAQNQANVAMQGNINTANAGVAQVNAQNQAKLLGGALNGISGGAAFAGLAGKAEGGKIEGSGPRSYVAKYLAAGGKIPSASAISTPAYATAHYAEGGKVPVMVSPGEIYVPPSKVAAVAHGKEAASKAGRKIPGHAKVKGDSYANDTVPAKLEKGGIVIPRSVLESDRPMAEAIKFVHAHMAKGGLVGGLKAKRGNKKSK